MIEDLLLHRITLYRESDDLFEGALPINASLNQTFSSQPVTLEISIPLGNTTSLLITGLKNGIGKQETVVFDGTLPIKVTSNAFDGITSVQSFGGNATSVIIRLRSQFGQPVFTETALVTNYPARISKDRQGALTIRREQLTTQDTHVIYMVYGPNKIKPKDELVHIENNDRYKITDVDDIYDGEGYHHTESTIALIDAGIE